MRSSAPSVSALVTVLVLLPSDAQAYLDPGTGSILIQGIIAGIASVLIALRAFRHRISHLFRRGRPSVGRQLDDERRT